MALYLLQSGIQPLGQFDLLDGTALVGGEVMTLDKVAIKGTDVSSFDAKDAYVATADNGIAYRVAARLATGSDAYMLCLADEGTAGYGVIFGSVIGASCGQTTTGTNLGPATYVGSGKVTLYDKPGLFAVSTNVLASGLLTLSGTTIMDTPLPGASLFANGSGLFTTTGTTVVARFIEMTNSGGMVQTPARLFASGATTTTFDRAVIEYLGVK